MKKYTIKVQVSLARDLDTTFEVEADSYEEALKEARDSWDPHDFEWDDNYTLLSEEEVTE